MTNSIAFLDPATARFLADHTTPPSPLEQRLIDETAQRSNSRMQIGAPQARFMALLARLLRPRLVVEIGTFTGYSSLVVAQELDPGARLVACDRSTEYTDVARRYWAEAGVDDRIELHIGPAAETLAALPDDQPVDLAFIDADKTGYLGYYEQLVPRLSERGVLLIDNMLWSGAVADPSVQDADTVALRNLSARVVADDRVEVALLPIGDGLSFITRGRVA